MRPTSTQAGPDAETARAAVNDGHWVEGSHVEVYANRDLRPPEAVLLLHHQQALSGRVLELGCGGGRLTGYLLEISPTVEGIDLSSAMVEHCRRRYPRGTFAVRDLRDLEGYGESAFDAVVAPFNVLDVLGEAERATELDLIRRVLAPGGLFVLSTHNRAFAPSIKGPLHVWDRNPAQLARNVVALPRRLANRRRQLPLEHQDRDYAILNDNGHDYSILHYYIERDAQVRQLADHGFELIECLDLDGEPVGPGQRAPSSSELHYVARRSEEAPRA